MNMNSAAYRLLSIPHVQQSPRWCHIHIRILSVYLFPINHLNALVDSSEMFRTRLVARPFLILRPVRNLEIHYFFFHIKKPTTIFP